MRPRFPSSWWPNGCISLGFLARRSRCRTTSFKPSGSRCTTILIFAGSLIFCARELDRIGPAQADLCRDFFCRAVGLELSFFEAAYTTSVSRADLATAQPE
jgi:thiaminase/transcriptional activator TenA